MSSSDDGRPDLSWFDQQISEIGEVDTSNLPVTPPVSRDPEVVRLKEPKAKANPYARERRYEKVYDDDDEDQEEPLDSPCDIATFIADEPPQSIRDLARQFLDRVRQVAGDYKDQIGVTIYIDSEDGCSEELKF